MEEPSASAFSRHYNEIYRFVRRRSANDAEAEEITQMVFAHAAERLDAAAESSPPVLAWLYTVAHRRLADAARIRARRGTALRLGDEHLAPVQPGYGPEVARALREGLDALPSEQRDVVVARLLEGRSFAEIAERLGSTEAACKMRFRRGLSTVREIFEREGITP